MMTILSKNPKAKKAICVLLIAIVILVGALMINGNISVSGFNNLLVNTDVTTQQPQEFPKFNSAIPNSPIKNESDLVDASPTNNDNVPLYPAVVKEETGLAMKYPQGMGVSMSKIDSNSFAPADPNSLLTDHKLPESYGESSLSDPTGINGADQGSRILKIKNLGDQNKFKPLDETATHAFATAYTNGGSIDTSELHSGNKFRNGEEFVNYADNYVPSSNFNIQSSPGQVSTLDNCETTYPNTEKYEDYCITDGDIPYGKVVNGKVNPRLVDRWQSYTGIYDRDAALNGIDGLLYPVLNILK